jgi:hypothetical protein
VKWKIFEEFKKRKFKDQEKSSVKKIKSENDGTSTKPTRYGRIRISR